MFQVDYDTMKILNRLKACQVVVKIPGSSKHQNDCLSVELNDLTAAKYIYK